MDITTILLIILIVLVIILIYLTLKKNNTRLTREMRQELSSMFMQTREEIRKYCYKNIAKYAVPSEYEFRTSLPKTAVGKVAYKDLEKKN